MFHIESFLSARLFLVPEKVGKTIFFISNMSGRLSLYAMDRKGSVPVPLLPPEIAVQNPHLVGNLYRVYPGLGKVLIMLDDNGDENYQPMMVPMDGGYPEPAFADFFNDSPINFRFHLGKTFPKENLAYFLAESRQKPLNITFQVNLKTGESVKLFESVHAAYADGVNGDYTRIILNEGYTVGDQVLYLWENGQSRLLYGTPIDQREPEKEYPLSSIYGCHFIREDHGLLFFTAMFEDCGGLGTLDLDNPEKVLPVEIRGVEHHGVGEFEGLHHLKGNRYLAFYNIDGASWVYEGSFNEEDAIFSLERVITGKSKVSNGVLEHISWEEKSENLTLSFSTATSPTQIYRVKKQRKKIWQLTREKVLAIPQALLSAGEDASFTSFDGLRISARLYLPAQDLGLQDPRPLVYYIHGGPQSQERPDFSWFSMPLIQFLTLNGFAVFVPNVRGSSGYGLSYMKKVDRDWGGDDRLDHVHAMTNFLPQNSRLDLARAGVVGRSYGGYMTLTLASRHPELWKASCDMFGPYDLITFSDRIPETWKPYFKMSIGDPDIPQEREDLIKRSPKTYMENLAAPMLVIQGKNDPRVVEQESRDIVDYLNSIGKNVEYLMFEDEGHDVLKFENRVRCYSAITNFFKRHLTP
jgi:pimeloyl-ACP methyl ester carboxylesterase